MTFARFQTIITQWLNHTFGYGIAQDQVERNFRFLEESLELFQSCGRTREEALKLVDYVYGRPIGKPFQEVGGVIVTLAALCQAYGIDLGEAAKQEHMRIVSRTDEIRKKQALKPRMLE